MSATCAILVVGILGPSGSPPAKGPGRWAAGKCLAYPLMAIGHEKHVATIRAWLDELENLLPIGRSGMFKYNNQDHAIATGLLAARAALGLKRFDPWLINIDAEYHEAGPVS